MVSSIHAGSSASTATTTTSTPSSLSSLTSGLAVRITTGAPLPSNATAVVMVEDTELLSSSPDGSTELSIRVTCPVSDSENVREIGSDTRRGELVLQKGTLVTQIGGEIGVLVSCGVVRVKVYKKPVVAVLSTGNELVDLSAAATAAEVDRQKLSLEYGQIWDSNRPSLMAAIRAAGFEVIDLGIVRDG